MNTYEKIREIRNQKLYDGEPPLEFGCETDEGIFIGERISQFDKPVWKYTLLCFDNSIRGQNYVSNDVLGKPVSLQDILIVLGKAYMIAGNGVIEKWSKCHEWEDRNEDWKYVLKLDITKEIKDQEPEVLEKILELIQ